MNVAVIPLIVDTRISESELYLGDSAEQKVATTVDVSVVRVAGQCLTQLSTCDFATPNLLKKNSLTYPDGLAIYAKRREFGISHAWLGNYSIYLKEDLARTCSLEKIRTQSFKDFSENRAFGVFLGLIVGDALGAPLEFSDPKTLKEKLCGFSDIQHWRESCRNHNRFNVQPGQWTDDTSMALCLADSLLTVGDFDPNNLKMHFLNWSAYGYNTPFASDMRYPEGRGSFGLGGTIQMSLQEFVNEQMRVDYTQMGDWHSSGNGSIMRLAPVPIYYSHDIERALEVAYLQSKTTHQGEEAAECARLLTYILVRGINTQSALRGKDIPNLIAGFTTPLESVKCLAESQAESETYCLIRGLNPSDRNWNWKDPNFHFSDTRALKSPSYLGSYVMDCLAMALHIVYETETFLEAVLKAANLGGDADTLAAVTGQIAGVVYGAKSVPGEWIETILQWDTHNDIPLRIEKLYHKKL